MKTKYTTEAGSEYIIDDVAKTWERKKGENAAEIRSDSGTYLEIDIDLSDDPFSGGIDLICPPFDPLSNLPRYITSTRIVKVEKVD